MASWQQCNVQYQFDQHQFNIIISQMSKKSTAVPKEMPKKPSSFYFRFRSEALKKHKGSKNVNQLIKEDWEKITEEEKNQNKIIDKEALDQYKLKLKEWEKANPGQVREKSKRKAKKDDTSDDEDSPPKAKVEKTKGLPKGKGKKEEEVEKVEKGKGKGKEEESKPKRNKK